MKIHNYDTKLEELLACPFCGKEPIAFLKGNAFTKTRSITIKCPNCMISRTIGAIKQSIEWLEDTAIRKWNTRV